ncbi:hypothetical protein SETIT_6G195700v2 [Setaria italica]|uniref:Uncharacterized protein n=3 Tax=Setaria TaxID=4554 RepID=A0A368RN73_SETIT|nr:hypothetical protein SETIT_6G195700v2 [Setaria italica]TKW10961.1 hypothetical protein SEVIR_6G203000v2 [Setaria viridis]
MDRRVDRKRAREGEEVAPAAGKKRGLQAEDAAVAALFDEAAATAAALAVADGGEGAWQRPAGVFDLPWQKCRNGLGFGGCCGWELRDVFFRSLVDGRAAAIGVPGDRLSPPPSKRTLFDDLDAWLAAAGDGEVDPLWRSVLEGAKPAA